jgi:hypothetical protein
MTERILTNRIGDIKPKFTLKIRKNKGFNRFCANISTELLAERLITFKAEGITPNVSVQFTATGNSTKKKLYCVTGLRRTYSEKQRSVD